MRSALVVAGRLTVAALLAVVALAGCNGDDNKDAPAATSNTPKEVRTTRVEVVKGLGQKGSFDPQALYKRLSPGVVTIISIFDEGKALIPGSGGGGGGQGSGFLSVGSGPRAPKRGGGGQGSGFLLDGDGHVATNAHVVTDGDLPNQKRAKQVYVELSDGNRVEARILGVDPNADVALLKIDPAGLRLTPLKLGSVRDLTVGEPVAAIG